MVKTLIIITDLGRQSISYRAQNWKRLIPNTKEMNITNFKANLKKSRRYIKSVDFRGSTVVTYKHTNFTYI